MPSGLESPQKLWVADAGDGFSPRAEDSVLHGCVPVVIMDTVDPVFSSILEWSAFSIRIAEVGPSTCKETFLLELPLQPSCQHKTLHKACTSLSDLDPLLSCSLTVWGTFLGLLLRVRVINCFWAPPWACNLSLGSLKWRFGALCSGHMRWRFGEGTGFGDAQADIERLPQILLAVPKARLKAMQRALRTVWQRFMWSSLPIFRGIVRDLYQSTAPHDPPGEACCDDPARDDAFATVMQWLSHKAAVQGPPAISTNKLS